MSVPTLNLLQVNGNQQANTSPASTAATNKPSIFNGDGMIAAIFTLSPQQQNPVNQQNPTNQQNPANQMIKQLLQMLPALMQMLSGGQNAQQANNQQPEQAQQQTAPAQQQTAPDEQQKTECPKKHHCGGGKMQKLVSMLKNMLKSI